jgi:hypothetical protein
VERLVQIALAVVYLLGWRLRRRRQASAARCERGEEATRSPGACGRGFFCLWPGLFRVCDGGSGGQLVVGQAEADVGVDVVVFA